MRLPEDPETSEYALQHLTPEGPPPRHIAFEEFFRLCADVAAAKKESGVESDEFVDSVKTKGVLSHEKGMFEWYRDKGGLEKALEYCRMRGNWYLEGVDRIRSYGMDDVETRGVSIHGEGGYKVTNVLLYEILLGHT